MFFPNMIGIKVRPILPMGELLECLLTLLLLFLGVGLSPSVYVLFLGILSQPRLVTGCRRAPRGPAAVTPFRLAWLAHKVLVTKTLLRVHHRAAVGWWVTLVWEYIGFAYLMPPHTPIYFSVPALLTVVCSVALLALGVYAQRGVERTRRAYRGFTMWCVFVLVLVAGVISLVKCAVCVAGALVLFGTGYGLISEIDARRDISP